MSDEDVKLKQNVDLEELKRRCLPPTPEGVEKRLAGIRSKISGKVATDDTNSDDATSDDVTFVEECGDMVFPPADVHSVA